MVFHEITPEAIDQAVSNPREINDHLVDAQETRRILDRLYGYEVSPVLWKKVMPRLSAGRVQSVATRLVVDRERERIAFRAAAYWDIGADLDAGETKDPRALAVRLVSVDGRRVAVGRDFGSDGALKASSRDTVVHLDEARAPALAAALGDSTFTVRGVEAKPYTRKPYAPFRTTTLQQEAARKLGFGAARDHAGGPAAVRERLHHLHAYRLDHAVGDRDQRGAHAGPPAVRRRLPAGRSRARTRTRSRTPRRRTRRSARRATGSARPAETGLRGDEFRLYELIWMRTVASQMRDAQGRSVTIRVGARGGHRRGHRVQRVRQGHHVPRLPEGLRRGCRRAHGRDRLVRAAAAQRRRGRHARRRDRIAAEGHETRPPARYTEATLVRELEEREIGRPSTYASIIGTILDRGYIYKKGTALVPTWLAFAVVRLLEQHFAHLVDYNFTASMEDALDEIARGGSDMQTWLARFYFGDTGDDGLQAARHRAGRHRRPRDLDVPAARQGRRGAGVRLQRVERR